MPALRPTDFTGQVVFLGGVKDREARLASDAKTTIEARFDGFSGESHAGLTRPSDNRVTSQHPLGTEIRNTRQFSIVSDEELALIAADMGLEMFDPRWLGASMVIRGIPDFTYLPPSSRLQFASGATLVVDLENRPCNLPAPEIEKDAKGFGAKFKPAAKGRRGVTAWVEREGPISVGDSLRLHVPDQPPWEHFPF